MRYLQRSISIAGFGGLVAALMVACGGGGANFAGIDRLGVSTGTITGFGSVIVNGVRYDTRTASFTIDDSAGSESDLQVGQVVTLNWVSSDNGVTYRANDVSYSGNVRGQIASINAAAGSFVVLGQTVLVDAGTAFAPGISPADISGLAVADNVEVSGLIDANGAVRATRIERKTGPVTLKLRGTATAVTATTFSINGQVVNYGSAMLEGFPGGRLPAAGDFVDVKGDSVNGSNQLVADEVEFEDEGLPRGNEGDEAEVEGFVTSFSSASSFSVSGVPVTTRAGTTVTGGTVTLNAKVEVEGLFNADGVLVADKIEVKTGTSGSAVNARLTSVVDTVNAGANQLVVLGVTVTVNASTRLEDKSDADIRPFGLANLSAGDFVEIQGVAQSGGSMLATSLEREDPEEDGVLRGPVSAPSNPSLTILGRTVTTSGITQFRNASGNSIDAATFFSTVTEGTEVKIKFRISDVGGSGTPVPAREAEIED